jgi:hypothetical protein
VLALLGAHYILYVSRIRVNEATRIESRFKLILKMWIYIQQVSLHGLD